MRVILKVLSGPRAGASFVVPEGGAVRFGRTNQADCAFPEDTFLSGVHFAVGCRRGRAFVSDLGSTNGTFVNDRRIQQSPVNDKDRVGAGHTMFQILYEEEGKSPVPVAVPPAAGAAPDDETHFRAPLSPLEKSLVHYLGQQQEPVYAVMDAARDSFVVPVIQAFGEEYRSLYEGASEEKLADCAPYLVRVATGSRLAEELSHGWGKSWGVYLTCSLPLPDLRRHLRHFLKVEIEQGKSLLFRFYDPRALRVFLPTCSAQEVRQFFGPVASFHVEDESPESLIRFRQGLNGAEREVVALVRSPLAK